MMGVQLVNAGGTTSLRSRRLTSASTASSSASSATSSPSPSSPPPLLPPPRIARPGTAAAHLATPRLLLPPRAHRHRWQPAAVLGRSPLHQSHLRCYRSAVYSRLHLHLGPPHRVGLSLTHDYPHFSLLLNLNVSVCFRTETLSLVMHDDWAKIIDTIVCVLGAVLSSN